MEHVDIDGCSFVRLKLSISGEGFSLWIGAYPVGYGYGLKEDAIRHALQLDNEIQKIVTQSVL
jgi:hypothetical protein